MGSMPLVSRLSARGLRSSSRLSRPGADAGVNVDDDTFVQHMLGNSVTDEFPQDGNVAPMLVRPGSDCIAAVVQLYRP
jgi:hypothetical protein